MGNAAPRAQPQSVLDSASQYRTFLMDYTPRSMDMMFGSLIGDGKFLKSISCKCDEGHLVVKIYRKYDERESLTSAEVALRRLALAFSVEQQPNVIPYADFQLSNKYNVAFMVRQYFASNLYDRICSRPFLTSVEKKWIAFQLLRALEQSHAKGICHGDIKQENVMVTSWNWVFLTDFAPFKPTYIPEDDPADYNYYFCAIDATRRGCSVAPERFYGKGSGTSNAAATGSTCGSAGLNSMKAPDVAMMLSKMADSEITVEEVDKQILAMGMNCGTMSGSPVQTHPSATANGSAPSSYLRSRREGSLLESMDIFSAGCVIAELFLGGKPLFDLPSLLKYRTGDSEALRHQLKKVGDPRLEELLLHMLQLDPNARLSASGYLAKYTGSNGLFPTYFDIFLFRFLVLVLSRGGKVPDARIRLVCKYYGRLVREVAGVEDPEGEEFFKLRLKEGYGSDRLATATGGDQQTHVAQRVLEELYQKIPTKHDKQNAEQGNAVLTKLQKMKEKENDMRGLSASLQKKKIERLHDQFQALTQKKETSLLLDYSREPSAGRLDEEICSENTEAKEGVGLDINGSTLSKSNTSTPPPHSSNTRRMKPPAHPGSEPWPHDRNGIVIILSLICSSLRHVQVPESKLTSLYLIRSLGQFTSDEARLQRLIPYLLEVIDDPSATVRALSLRTITYLLSLVESFPLADASVFPQYVLPAMVPFQSDPDELVRITFAECLPQLAETSRRFLEIAHAMKQKILTSSASTSSMSTMSARGNDSFTPSTLYMASSSFDKELSVLHKMISRFVIQLTTPDQKASSSLVKRALLVDITRLCVFFGQERTLDVVLPQLITFLNDPDWELRGAFFDYIVGVCSFVGPEAVEQNILPCIEQALFDVQEVVITKAVECLTGLCQLGLFQKKISTLVEKARMTCSLLLHPSWWIRDAVLKLMGEIALKLRSVDANVFLSPLLRPFLHKTMVFLPDEEVPAVTKRLRHCCRLHVSRETFDRALLVSSSSSGLNEVITEMERSVSHAFDDSDDDMVPPTPLSAMTTTSRQSLEDPISDVLKPRQNRDALLISDSLDGHGSSRQQLSGAAVATSAAVTAATISNSAENGMRSVYDQRKNEIQSLKLMQQYVSIASMQMRSKLEMAKTEQAARMQRPSKSDRAGSPHGSMNSTSVAVGGSATGTSSNPFARKLSRSHLRVLFVPDMRFALSTAQPLKSNNFGIPSPSSAAASSTSTSTSATTLLTALVARPRCHAPNSSPSHHGGSAISAMSNGVSMTGSPSLESLSLSHVGKMYSLVEPSTHVSASPVTASGPSSVVPPGSISSALDDSGVGQIDSNHFAPTSGGVMVSMLNMNMRLMYGGDGMNSLLDPHHHPVHASPVSPSRQRMNKKAHTTYHHYFAFKESAMDPALGNPRKLMARLNALGIPPLPPDLGALRLFDGSPYSIYSHASSPYCLMGGGVGISKSAGGNGTPGSDRGGTNVSNVTSSPNQVGSGTYPPGVGPFNAAAAAAAAINGGVAPSTFGSSNSSTGSGSSSSSGNGGSGSGGYPSSSHRNWHPRKNVLVAELAEHSGAVTRVNAAQDYSFLASASNDGTVKIWSVRSLLHSVNQGSRCTYDGQGGVITDMKVLTNSHSVASASSDGTVHVFRVDKVNSVGGNVHASGLKELRANNSAVMAIDYLNNITDALLLYATRDGKIHAWDLRMRQEAWTLSISPELGYVTCMTHSLDVSWLAVGTSKGFLCLWDLRFLVLIRIWRHSSHRAIHRLQPCLGLPNTLPLDETSVPLVFVAAGDGEVAVFDLSIGACRAVFRTLEVQASEAEVCKCPTLLHVAIPHRSRSVLGSFLGIYGIATAFDEISTSPLSEEPSVRAMLCPSLHLRGIGDALITGGEDRQLRYWDIRNGKQSYTICGNGEAKSFYDNQTPPHDWWRMPDSASRRFGVTPAAPVSTTNNITKPEMAWSKLNPPLITICQDSSVYSTAGGVAASDAGGVESAISMERRGLVPPSPAHTDCILDLTLVELGSSQNPSPMLVSSARDALIKVWK